MSMDCTSTANRAGATTAVVQAAPVAFGGFFKTSYAQFRHFLSINRPSSAADQLVLNMDSTSSTSGKVALTTTAGGVGGQVSGVQAPANTWFSAGGNFVTNLTRYIWLNGGNRVTGSGTIAPTGLGEWLLSGRPGDRTQNIGGLAAHIWFAQQGLDDVEMVFLGLGGHPRGTNVTNYYKCNRAVSGSIPDEIGSIPFPVTGSFVLGADDPSVASWFIGNAISNQTWNQNNAIVAIPLSTSWDDVSAPFTRALYQVSASSSGSSTTTASGTNSRIVSITSLTALGVAVGDYVSIAGGAKTRVNAIFTTTAPAAKLLVQDKQTFASSAAITRFTAAPATVAGISVTTTINGTPTGTQGVTAGYFVRSINSAFPANVSLTSDSNTFSIQVVAIPVAPSFSTQPTVVAIQTDGFTVSFTPNTACTIDALVLAAGTAQPTAATIKAQASGLAHASKAIIGADSLILTGIDFPVVDIWLILTNAQGDSSIVGLLSQQKAPPAGKVYRTFTSIDPNTRYNGNCAIGDIEETDTTVSPSGAVVSYSPDGNESFTATGRQLRVSRVYSVAGKAWILDVNSQILMNVWYNDVAPVFTGDANTLFVLTLNTPVNISLRSLFTSVDVLVISNIDVLPAGLSINNGSLVGQVSANVNGTYAIAGTDSATVATIGRIGIVAGKVKAPRLLLLAKQDAIAVVLADHLKLTAVDQDDNGPPGIVLRQDPVFNTDMNPFDTITVFVSKTPAGAVPYYGLRNHSFQIIPKANGDLDLSDPTGV